MLWGSMEVWVKNLESSLLVSGVNDTKRGSGIESVPVCGLGNPLEVVLQKGVVGGVGIHHRV